MMQVKDLLTVVIPCKNEEDYIYETLKGISNQSNSDGVRVVVADAGSTDGTLLEIERARVILNIEVDVIKGGHVSVGRNRGAKSVKTPYVVFIDADTVLLDENTLEKAVKLLSEGSADLVTCTTVNTSNDFRAKLAYSIFSVFRNHFMKEPFAQGTFIATTVDKFFEAGMFDETVSQSEDFLFSRKFKRSSFVVLKDRVSQDDRRFRKMGYYGFIKLVLSNYINRNNPHHFKRDVGYW
jgi:glycosyltransferase involved in cell wall biosynthesis